MITQIPKEGHSQFTRSLNLLLHATDKKEKWMQRSFVHNTIGGRFVYEIGESAYSCGLLTGIEHEKCVDGM